MFDGPVARKLIEVKDLKMHFPIFAGLLRRQVGAVKALDGVSFDIYEGETLGLVGESGCGKSTCGRAILRLYDITEGSIKLDGKEIGRTSQSEMRRHRPAMQMVFQDPQASLNPRMTVARLVGEPLDEHTRLSKTEKLARVDELMDAVGLNRKFTDRYPHEFSGGQRQRIAIARAMILKPQAVILDEPTSALDRSVQGQVIELLRDLQTRHGLSYVFISHDLSVVRAISDYVVVMKDGKIVEEGLTDAIFSAPQEAYTKTLIGAAYNIGP